MTTFSISLAVALGVVAIALQSAFPPRELTWRHAPARLMIVAQGVMTFVLIAGLLGSPDTEFVGWLFVGWMLGSAIGWPVAAWRWRTPGHVDSTPELA